MHPLYPNFAGPEREITFHEGDLEFAVLIAGKIVIQKYQTNNFIQKEINSVYLRIATTRYARAGSE